MNTTENPVRDSAGDESAASARSERVSAVAWMTGITSVVALTTLRGGASVSTGLGVIGVSAMVAIVSYFILRG